MSLKEASLTYGYNHLWPTTVKLANLLEQGVVGEDLHAWLEKFADMPELVTGPNASLYDKNRKYTRYDISVFSSPRHPELASIKKILIDQVDQYVRETVVDPLPEHEKFAVLWFVIQHPNNLAEAVYPHYHEGADVAFAYYLSTPSNRSGANVMVDPRGPVGRGSRALGRHDPVMEYFPKRGDIMILPRYILHYTDVNTDAHDRKVIGGVVLYDKPRSETVPFLVEQNQRNAAA